MSSFRPSFHTNLLLSSPSKRTMNLANPLKRTISLASRRNPTFRPLRRLEPRHYSTEGLLASIMEAVEAMRLTRKQLRPVGRVVLAGSQEVLNTTIENRVLQKGILLEFQKDYDRTLLAVAQKPDGKRNWMVSDQVL